MCVAKYFGNDLVRQLARRQLEALGCPTDAGALAQQWFDLLQRFTKAVTGHGNENVRRTLETGLEVDRDPQVFGKRNAGQVFPVLARRSNALEFGEIATPKPNLTVTPCKLQRERRAPGAGANDGNRCRRRCLGSAQ